MKKPAKGSPTAVEELQTHPMADLLRMDRMPHIWCSSCGLGSSLTCFIMAVRESGVDEEKVAVVSGIGCTGRVAGYVNLDSFHTTHGRAVPFAAGLALSNPELRVVVFSGDGDIVAIDGRDSHALARPAGPVNNDDFANLEGVPWGGDDTSSREQAVVVDGHI